MKLAIFKNMEYGYETPGTEAYEKFGIGQVRISDYVDVDFPPLRDEQIVRQQIDELDKLADKKTTEYRKFMAGIDERKSKLLAITHQPSEQ